MTPEGSILRVLLAAVLLAALLAVSNASIINYNKFLQPTDLSVAAARQAVFAKNFTPAGDKDPFIRVHFNMTTPGKSLQRIDALVYPYAARESIGVQVSEGTLWCCTQSMADNTQCSCPEGYPCAAIKPNPLITRVDVWYVRIVKCHTAPLEEVTLAGQIVFENPYGYLPGRVYSLMPLAGWMALFYLVLGLGFMVLSAFHWRELLQVQFGIAALIALGMLECACWFFFYNSFNSSGYVSNVGLFFAVFFTVLKKTFARGLFLLVSMGLGVMKSTIGATKYKVAVLIVACFGFDLALEVMDVFRNFSPTFEMSQGTALIAILPKSVLDTAYLWWLFVSLQRTRQQLILRRQQLKSWLYKTFFNLLVAIAVVACLAMIYQMFVVASVNNDDASWHTKWIWDAFWQFLLFLVIVAVAILWRPRKNNTRYGYSELGNDDDDDTIMQLPGFSEALTDDVPTKSSQSDGSSVGGASSDQYETDREKNIRETSGSGDLKSLDNLAPFSLSEDEHDAETMVRKMD